MIKLLTTVRSDYVMQQTYFIASSSGELNYPELGNAALFAVGNDVSRALLAINIAFGGEGVKYLCNSDPKMAGKSMFGYNIINTWELIAKKNVHFIIPQTSEETLHSIVRQLRLNGIEKYSVIFPINIPAFDAEEKQNAFSKRLTEVANEIFHKDIKKGKTLDSPLIYRYCNWLNGACWWNKIYEWIYESEKKADSMILDIGPGEAVFSGMLHELCGVSIDAVDLTAHNDDYASDVFDNIFVANIELDSCDMLGKYNIIIMTEIIEHFNYNPVPTLKKIAEHLCDDGILYLSCPHWREYYTYSAWRDMPYPGTVLPMIEHGHIYEFSHKELLEIFKESGLKVINEGYSAYGNSNFALRKY